VLFFKTGWAFLGEMLILFFIHKSKTMKNIILILTLIFLFPSCDKHRSTDDKKTKPPTKENQLARDVLKKYYILGLERGYRENNNPLSKEEIKKLLQEDIKKIILPEN
jgi:uncharacterized membrane protein